MLMIFTVLQHQGHCSTPNTVTTTMQGVCVYVCLKSACCLALKFEKTNISQHK